MPALMDLTCPLLHHCSEPLPCCRAQALARRAHWPWWEADLGAFGVWACTHLCCTGRG